MNRAGRKTFDKCNVKVVEVKDFVFKEGSSGETVLSDNPSEDTRKFSGNSAVLHCPRTEDSRVSIESQFSNHQSRIDALHSLRNAAAEFICRGCVYATMTPLEASETRAKLLNAQATELEALKIRNAALEELQKSDPNFIFPTLEN